MKKNKKNIFKENLKTIIIVVVVLVIVFSSLIYNNFISYKKTYTVVIGSVEKVSDTYVYVLKDETILNFDKNMVAVPIVEQDKRASKGEVVAIYKNNDYDELQKKILSLDEEIQTLVKDLPAVYSSDVNTIDSQISEIIKEAKKENSYVKMQEYKNKVNELLAKKINILGELSPSGSKIRELVEDRNNLEKMSKDSNNNIKASVAGAVTYKIDELENIFDYNEVLNLPIVKLEEIINRYSNNNANNFGIKIVNNFQCYFLVKELDGENSQYIKVGKNYKINLMNDSSDSIGYAMLQKSIKGDGCTYNIFSIENNISNVLDIRTVGAEVIWAREEGLIVPLEAITEENNIKYVTLVNGGEYKKVPVKIIISNDSFGIVENYTSEEKDNLGLTNSLILEVYDQLVIDNGK